MTVNGKQFGIVSSEKVDEEFTNFVNVFKKLLAGNALDAHDFVDKVGDFVSDYERLPISNFDTKYGV